MKQVLIALDQLANTLFFWDANHCEEAHRSELLRRHLPRQYRQP